MLRFLLIYIYIKACGFWYFHTNVQILLACLNLCTMMSIICGQYYPVQAVDTVENIYQRLGLYSNNKLLRKGWWKKGENLWVTNDSDTIYMSLPEAECRAREVVKKAWLLTQEFSPIGHGSLLEALRWCLVLPFLSCTHSHPPANYVTHSHLSCFLKQSQKLSILKKKKVIIVTL